MKKTKKSFSSPFIIKVTDLNSEILTLFVTRIFFQARLEIFIYKIYLQNQ